MSNSRSSSVTESGIGFGCALAIAVSYTVNHHIGWAIVHGICSWFYVIYYALGGGHSS